MSPAAGEPDPILPPLLTSRPVDGPEAPLAAALARTEAADFEAGELFWARRPDRLQVALLLVPEVAAERAQEMLALGMVALADSVVALGEPQLVIGFRWPGTLLANGAEVGSAGLHLPAGSRSDEVPGWLVLSLELALRPAAPEDAPGLTPERTTIWDEGGGDLAAGDVLESVSRHLLAWIHRWEEEGFRPVHESWSRRAAGADAALGGRLVGLDEHGGALLETAEGMRTLSLLDRIGEPPA